MTYMDPNDPTRLPNDDPARRPSGVPDRGGISVWGFPLIVAAALVILGFVFFGTHERATTASNATPVPGAQTTPAATPKAPSGQPAPAAPNAAKQ